MAQLNVEGYEQFCEKVSNLEKDKKDIFILFSGSVDSSTGKNWCPDCVAAEPVIEEAIKASANLKEKASFLHVAVGPRQDWKDPNNPFRKDSRLKLKCVPTLLHWGKSERLEEEECQNSELVKMIFEEDD